MTLPSGREELERAARRVIDDYDAFLASGPTPGRHEDAKAFATHHAAARAALGHLEHLLKLVRAASGDHTTVIDDTEALLAQARSDIAGGRQHDQRDDDADEA